MGHPSGVQFLPNVCGCQKQVPQCSGYLVVGNLQRRHGKAAVLAIMTRPDSMHPTPALLSSTSYSSSWRILLLLFAMNIYFLKIQLVQSQYYHLGIREKQVPWKRSKGLERLIFSSLMHFGCPFSTTLHIIYVKGKTRDTVDGNPKTTF